MNTLPAEIRMNITDNGITGVNRVNRANRSDRGAPLWPRVEPPPVTLLRAAASAGESGLVACCHGDLFL